MTDLLASVILLGMVAMTPEPSPTATPFMTIRGYGSLIIQSRSRRELRIGPHGEITGNILPKNALRIIAQAEKRRTRELRRMRQERTP